MTITSNTGTEEMADWGWMEADMESAISKNLLDVQCSAVCGQESAGEHLPLASDKRGTSLLLTNPACRSLKRGEH